MSGLPRAPRYGRASLADVLPSLLAALGVGTFEDVLDLPAARRGCVVLVDGLGFHLLHRAAAVAPTLLELTRPEPLDAAYPTTTATNLASLGTGLPPGEHGLLGATVALPDTDRPMSLLHWKLAGVGPRVSLLERVPPERLQPRPTLLQRAEGAGLDPVTVGPRVHDGAGLNRAALRGAPHVGADHPAELTTVVPMLLRERDRRFVYAYHGALDLAGHVHGTTSDEWREALRAVDGLVGALLERLPPDTLLVVVADHGMVDVPEEGLLEVADEPSLLEGVRVLAGEPRLRHVHALGGAAADVLAAWRQVLGDRWWVASREQAIDAGWFGSVSDPVRERIGDVVVAARERVGMIEKAVDPRQRQLVGHHGSVTDVERAIPLVLASTSG